MPHGNKKTRVNAKKRSRANRPAPSTAPPPSQSSEQLPPRPTEPFEPNPPPLPSLRDDDRPTPVLIDSSNDSLYVRYKKCTQRFKDTLQLLVPPEIFPEDNVPSLLSAAEHLAGQSSSIPEQLLDDLKVAIRVRKRVAQDQFSGGDEGHSYFIAALAFCWSVLAPKRPRKTPAARHSKASKAPPIVNQFAALAVTDEEDLEEDLPASPLPRPEPVPTRLSLDELISGSDRMNVCLFFDTMDELMSFISLQYSKLKEAAAWTKKAQAPPDTCIEQMMEAAVATNFAIQQVASLEEIFIQDHPHLHTVYRMLACFVTVDLVATLTRRVTKKSPRAAQFTERDAVAFLGDVMECSFRNPSDPENKRDVLVEEFLKQWQFSEPVSISEVPNNMDELSVRLIFQGFDAIAKMEVPLFAEQSCAMREAARRDGLSSHTWLRNFTFIGQNRSITHTVRLLQGLSSLISTQQYRLMAKRGGMFGPSWKDRRTPATRIQLDMDSLFMEDIMPTLINMCYEGLLSQNLPYQEELLTVFSHIKMFVRHPESITWSLVFSAHAILTAVFEVQGEQYSFLAATAQASFDLYIRQLEWARQIPLLTIPWRPPIWEKNLSSMLRLRYLVVSPIPRSESEDMMSIWNPFCAGVFLSYIAYFGNLDGGTSLVDSVAQLRMTLHLFNALLQARAIQREQIILLDVLFDAFKNCKAVWEGPQPPVRGQYTTRWWIAYGMNARAIVQRQNHSSSHSQNGGRTGGDTTRTMTPIMPEQVSNSYRRICQRDFRDMVDKYHKASTRANQGDQCSTVYHYAVRSNNALDAMEDEEQLLGTNLLPVGHYLNQFCISLFNVWGFMPLIEQMVSEASPEIKQGRRTDFRSVSPNSWEASDENMKYQAMSHFFAKLILEPLDHGDALVASRCAEFMDMYFSKIPSQNCMWFTPTMKE